MKIGKIVFLICQGLFFTTTSHAQESKRSTAIDSTKYATLYIYRMHIVNTRNSSFWINVGDTSFKVKDNTAHPIRIYKEGELKIHSIKSETTAAEVLNVQFGAAYYLRCSLNPGIVTARPELIVNNSDFGKKDFDAINERKQ